MRKTLWLSETQTNACQSFARVMTVTIVGGTGSSPDGYIFTDPSIKLTFACAAFLH